MALRNIAWQDTSVSGHTSWPISSTKDSWVLNPDATFFSGSKYFKNSVGESIWTRGEEWVEITSGKEIGKY